jgi:LmbE family N-acetylglucosaminyl deacetylase
VQETLTRGLVLLVAAHPDDETISAGGILPRMQEPVIAHVTNGAPANPDWAHHAGYASVNEYAKARRQELLNALAIAGIGEERLRGLDIADQSAWLEMAQLAENLRSLLEELEPRAVLTHPYEGGHPDHDSTAFAVHAACLMLAKPPKVYEFTSYHSANGDSAAIETGRFLAGGDAGEAVALTKQESERKRRMIECFASQLAMVRQFPVDVERFRAAPVYDFTQPPHTGRLFYENFALGTTGEQWRLAAALAMRSLGIPETI